MKQNKIITKISTIHNESNLIRFFFNHIEVLLKKKVNSILYIENKINHIKKVYFQYNVKEEKRIPIKYTGKIVFHNSFVNFTHKSFYYSQQNKNLKMIFYIFQNNKNRIVPKLLFDSLAEYIFLQVNHILSHSQSEEYIKTKEKGIIGLNEFADLLSYLEMNEESAFQSMFLGFAAESIEASRVTFYFCEKDSNILYPNAIMVYKNKKVIPYDYYTELKDITIPVGDDVCGQAVAKQEPIFLEDTTNNNIYKGYVDKKIGLKIKSIICIPIIVHDTTIGVLELASTADNKIFNKFDFYIASIITKLARTKIEQGQLYTWAMTDNLTQLYNYHYLQTYLDVELARMKRYPKELGLILLDIDNFKTINDSYGHSAGNIVLRGFSKIIKQNIRLNIDIPIRYGGDEFLIILPETNLDGTHSLSKRILDSIRSYQFKINGDSIQATCSIGINNMSSQNIIENKDDIIQKADIALYKAKNSGKNKICITE